MFFFFAETGGYSQLGDAMQQLGVGTSEDGTPPPVLAGYASMIHAAHQHHQTGPPPPGPPTHYGHDDQDYQSLDPSHQPAPYFESSPELYAGTNLLDSKYHPQNYTKGYVRGKTIPDFYYFITNRLVFCLMPTKTRLSRSNANLMSGSKVIRFA